MQDEEIFHVIKPGILTTFQDMGRTGYQRYGVPVSGAMDRFALQVANILVGNARDSACLEVTLIGPELEAITSITMAVTGADLEPNINGKLKPMWKSFRMNKGDKLKFGKYQSGVRSYIAIAGGFDSPTIFGSQSTDIKSGFGSPLDKVAKVMGFPTNVKHGIGLPKQFIPTYEKSIEVAIIEGPHTNYFTNEDIETFYSSTYTVDTNSDRMGYRLSSAKVLSNKGSDIWSDAVPFGGIQLPQNGRPIILMADRQTTGGYPRIGTVITSDLPKIAQLVPRGKIRFYPVSIEEAQKRAIEMEQLLNELAMFRKGFQ